jgi:glycosyltransferase involved in cell wall biosynthesis
VTFQQLNLQGTWPALGKAATPYFVLPHGMLDPWFNRTYPLKHLKKMLYWPWAEYRVLRDAKAVLFTSEEERRLARKSFAPYRCNEVVVNYGTAAPEIDLPEAREEFLNAFPKLRGKNLLLFLGRIQEKKGCEELIRACAAIERSSLQLVIAGPCANDGYLQRLKRLTNKLDREKTITLSGMLTGNLKWGAFAAAEAFILPSHQENFGIAVVEALACGTPVLISNKINIWREIVNDACGFAAEDDVAGTRCLIERWLATPTPERREWRQRAALLREPFRNQIGGRFNASRPGDQIRPARPREEIADPKPAVRLHTAGFGLALLLR